MSKKGFTLIEILIGASLGAIVLGGLFVSIVFSNRITLERSAYLQSMSYARFLLSLISKQIMQAVELNEPQVGTPCPCTIDITQFNRKIEFRKVTYDSLASNYVWSEKIEFEFMPNSRTLRFKDEFGNSVDYKTNFSGVRFSKSGLHVTIEIDVPHDGVTETIRREVALRSDIYYPLP